MQKVRTPAQKRPEQIRDEYLRLIDRHLEDLVHGGAEDMFEIEDLASQLFIHPTHLSNTIKAVTGESACGVYQLRIVAVAERLLADPKRSVRDVALMLTFEPSQFSKWFKRFNGQTPRAYRRGLSLP